ncbi:type 1 glutamine amidotransferase domain-containing protein [Spongiibacter sp. KMU-166]|uniref:Type 1 glutamine amidotransferase domain-containing protein n=1 Tax=Spongiibacter thalassae TaxID=2721624 RepID=A0ABX1GC16_9GAMM|nr:type 1 glutamine amidotransferase domain-containing protein [Spongiibacter thalassae]
MKKILKVGLPFIAGTLAVIAIALPTILHNAGLHPEYTGEVSKYPGGKALIITTSHGVLSEPGLDVGPATGVAASEMTHPYYVFQEAGMDVDVASIQGGSIPIDPQTLSYPIITDHDKRFLEDSIFQAKASNSIAVRDVDISKYDVIFLAGGWGAAYDMGNSEELAALISAAYYSPKAPVVASVCHGALGLIGAKDNDGKLLIEGRRATGVTDKQVKELGIKVTPMHPETELRKAGAVFESATAFRDIFATWVTVDDEQRFVTGQNQNSGLEAAYTSVNILAQRKIQ